MIAAKEVGPSATEPLRKTRLVTGHRPTAALWLLLVGCPTCYVLVYYLCGWMFGESARIAFDACYPFALVWLAALVLFALLRRRSPGIVLLALNALWLVATQWLAKEELVNSDGVCCWALVFCGLFAACACLQPDERRWFLAGITLLLVLVLLLWATAGLITALRGRPVSRLPQVSVQYEDAVPPLVYVRFGELHRNISSTFFVVAAGLLLYWSFRCGHETWQGRLWRSITLAYVPFAFCAVAMQRCRSVYAAFGFVIASALALLVSRQDPRQGVRRRLLAIGLVSVTVTALLYVSLGICANTLLSRAQATIESQKAAELAQAQEEAEASAKEGDATAIPTAEPSPVRRGTSWNTFTLAGRTTIWREVIPVLLAHPKIALRGHAQSSAMDAINARITWPYGLEHPEFAHMHNMFLEQLMIAGVPGLVLQVLFVLSLLKDLAACWRLRAKQSYWALLILGATIIALLFYGLLEPLLVAAPPASMLFYLVAGYVAASVWR